MSSCMCFDCIGTCPDIRRLRPIGSGAAQRSCDPSKDGDVSSYHTKGLVSTIGFIVGGVGLAGGAVLILTAPKSHASATIGQTTGPGTFISPYIGPGSAGITGKF